jgi:alpha-L-fucosidase
MKIVMMISLWLLVCTNTVTQAEDKFEATAKSLENYRCPEWFRDAKFGIYCHWNAQSASKSSSPGWYARNMYIQNHRAYKDHLKNWGHPSKVGYKDVVKAWNADKFDAAEWVKIFKNSGAKYIVTVATHHDNFDMWDSKHQPKWNSVNYGPKKDVCGEIRKETLKAGLRWGVSTHLGRTYSWLQTNKGADKKGPKKGVPYDGNDPAYKDLYLEMPDFSKLGKTYSLLRHPLQSPESWKQNWKDRMFDLIDNYHPDHFYFDGAVPFMDDKGQAGLDVIAHYYNHNASMHGGKNEGVMVFKDIKDHGIYYPGISSVVMERTSSPDIEKYPRQTENSVGPWFYTGNEKSYRSSKSLLHEMIDTVSKNNNFILNIPPRGDGSIDEASQKILKDFGEWFAVNGGAIYGTRPWHTFGEKNIRFTTRGNLLYAIVLNKPNPDVVIKSIKNWKNDQIEKIELIGGKTVSWQLTGDGLKISTPEDVKSMACVLKITSSQPVLSLPSAQNPSPPSVEEANREAARQYGADGDGGNALPNK